MKRNRKILLNWLIKIFGLALFLYIILKIDFLQVLESLKSFSYKDILILEILSVLIIISKGFRFHILLRNNNIKSNIKDTTIIYSIGIFLSFITPGHVGDFSKMFYLKSINRVSYENGFIINIVDRLFDLSVLILFSFFCISDTLHSKLGLLVVFLLLLTIIIFYLIFKNIVPLIRLLKRLLIKLRIKIFSKNEITQDSQPPFDVSIRKIGLPWAISLVPNIMIFYQGYYIANILAININFLYISGIFALANIISLVPITILGLGTRDATLITMLKPFGYSSVVALSISFSYFLFNTVGVMLICFIMFLFYRKSLIR